MPEFDIVFEKLTELTRETDDQSDYATIPTHRELDEIEELRRFAAETQADSEPPSFTTT